MDAERRKELESQLSAYIDGELTDAQRAEVEAFLDKDAQARQLLAELRATVAGLQALPRAKASEDLMASMRSRLERQALLGSAKPTGAMPSSTPSFGGRWIAAAAVIALAVVAGSVLWSFTDRDAQPRRDQFAMREPAEKAPLDTTVIQAEGKEFGLGYIISEDDKLEVLNMDMKKSDVPAAAPPQKQKGVSADLEKGSKMGRPMIQAGQTERLAGISSQSQNELALQPSRELLVEQRAIEGPTDLAGDNMHMYTPDNGKTHGETIGSRITTTPSCGVKVIARQELRRHRAVQWAASQPQEQLDSVWYFANRAAKLPVDHASLLYSVDSLQQPTTQPAAIPCRAASTQPSSTQPTASTKPAPQTQPSDQIIESISTPKPQTAPSRQ